MLHNSRKYVNKYFYCTTFLQILIYKSFYLSPHQHPQGLQQGMETNSGQVCAVRGRRRRSSPAARPGPLPAPSPRHRRPLAVPGRTAPRSAQVGLALAQWKWRELLSFNLRCFWLLLRSFKNQSKVKASVKCCKEPATLKQIFNTYWLDQKYWVVSHCTAEQRTQMLFRGLFYLFSESQGHFSKIVGLQHGSAVITSSSFNLLI